MEVDVVVDIVEVIVVEGYLEVVFVIVGFGLYGVDLYYGYLDCELWEGDIVVVDIGGMYGFGYYFDFI